MFDLSNIKPELLIQGGGILVALYALWNMRKLTNDQSSILKNHLKHHEDKDEEEIDSRNRLASAIQRLTDKIKE